MVASLSERLGRSEMESMKNVACSRLRLPTRSTAELARAGVLKRITYRCQRARRGTKAVPEPTVLGGRMALPLAL